MSPQFPPQAGQTPLERRTPLPRGRRRGFNSTLRPGGPLRQKGGDRFKAGRDPAYREWIRSLRCAVAGPACSRVVECTHVRSRGAGGADVGNCLPLCGFHHAMQHAMGIKTWATNYGIDPWRLSAKLGREYAALPTPARERDQ